MSFRVERSARVIDNDTEEGISVGANADRGWNYIEEKSKMPNFGMTFLKSEFKTAITGKELTK